MKKTLIALVALSGLAMADVAPLSGETVNAKLAEAITSTGYQEGDAFILTLTLNVKNHMDSNTGFLKFADAGWVINQQHKYWGINTSDSNSVAAGDYTKVKDGNNFTYTATNISPLWVQNDSLNDSTERAALWDKDSTLMVTIGAEANGGSYVTLAYGINDIVDSYKFTGVTLNANKILLDNNLSVKVDDYASFFSSHGKSILLPEPATATLSLLALAGLAARRRH